MGTAPNGCSYAPSGAHRDLWRGPRAEAPGFSPISGSTARCGGCADSTRSATFCARCRCLWGPATRCAKPSCERKPQGRPTSPTWLCRNGCERRRVGGGSLCIELFAEMGVRGETTTAAGRPLRLVDATLVKEPGPTGSLWRLHYRPRLPSLECDYLELTPSAGRGSGERPDRFPVRSGEVILSRLNSSFEGGAAAGSRLLC